MYWVGRASSRYFGAFGDGRSGPQEGVMKPRIRGKCKGKGGEVSIPVYEAINSSERMGEQILEILMSNVSTRRYRG